jgi:predicted lipid-binding transport protein (Tim44 family)
MPTRKQRRRREKNFRHEYETVLLDADGNERPLDDDDVRAEREARAQAKAETKPAARKTGAQPQRVRGMREVNPPSWDRALRRGGLMGGLMLVAFVFLFKNAPMGMRLAWGAFYAVAFIPLTYWVDRTAYRAYQRRLAKQQTQAQKK